MHGQNHIKLHHFISCVSTVLPVPSYYSVFYLTLFFHISSEKTKCYVPFCQHTALKHPQKLQFSYRPTTRILHTRVHANGNKRRKHRAGAVNKSGLLSGSSGLSKFLLKIRVFRDFKLCHWVKYCPTFRRIVMLSFSRWKDSWTTWPWIRKNHDSSKCRNVGKYLSSNMG